MAMSVGGGGDDEPMMDINTTPLIDVMLVLLIMFIITIPVMTHAVKLDMYQGGPPPSSPPEAVELEVDFDGTIIWNGTAVPNQRVRFDDPRVETRGPEHFAGEVRCADR